MKRPNEDINCLPYQNESMEETFLSPVQKLDVNYPQHMAFTIEESVPIPPIQRGSEPENVGLADTVAALGPGQCVKVDGCSRMELQRVRASVSTLCKRRGVRIVTRMIKVNGEAVGMRFWKLVDSDVIQIQNAINH